MCDHGCACDNLLQKVPSIHCTAQAQTNKSCITQAWIEVACAFEDRLIIRLSFVYINTEMLSLSQ